MTSDAGLVARRVSKWFGGQAALSDVSVSLRPGEVHGLIGHNGAGKSTLLRMFAGVHGPDEGSLLLDGEEVSFVDPGTALSRGIVTVYQELRVIGALSVTENIFLGREIIKSGQLDRKRMQARARELCAEFGIPATPTTSAGDLPVAHQQMLEVAAGLDRGAKYLLLDEPTTALEAEQIDHLLQVVRRVAASGVGVCIVDHKLDEIFAVADTVTALSDGQVVLNAELASVSREDVISAIVGDEAESRLEHQAVSPEAAPPPAPPLDVSDAVLSARELRTDACGPVNLDVPPGLVTALYGLVGSGRTEFLRALLGVDKIRAGSLTLQSKPYRPSGPAHAIAEGIAAVSEDRKREGIVPLMDSKVNAGLSVLSRFSTGSLLSMRRLAVAARAMLGSVGVRGDVDLPISSMSGGNQQKVLIARALMCDPKLLILDEPTKGVDIGAKAEIHRMIMELAHSSGIGVLVVSSEEEEVLTIADRIVIFAEGGTDGTARASHNLTVQALRRLALPHNEVLSAVDAQDS